MLIRTQALTRGLSLSECDVGPQQSDETPETLDQRSMFDTPDLRFTVSEEDFFLPNVTPNALLSLPRTLQKGYSNGQLLNALRFDDAKFTSLLQCKKKEKIKATIHLLLGIFTESDEA